MMYNPQLETFLRVADAGSFNRAAEELFITPPAVIKQITSLETSLDLQLFVRSPRGLKLTEAGKSIYRDAQYVVQYCKDSVVRAKNAAEEGDKVIRIGVSPNDARPSSCWTSGRPSRPTVPILNSRWCPMRTPGELGGNLRNLGHEHRYCRGAL